MINISVAPLSPNILIPTFDPASVTLTSINRAISGLDSRTVPTDLLLGNYPDFAGVKRTADWLTGSIASGVAALVEKVGARDAVSNMLAIETSWANTRMYSAGLSGGAAFTAQQVALSNAVDNADYDMDEAAFRATTALSLAKVSNTNEIALSSFEKTGETAIAKMGYVDETAIAVAEAAIQQQLTGAIVADDYLTTEIYTDTKSRADVLMEQTFERPQALFMTGIEEDNKDALNLLDIQELTGKSAIEVAGILNAGDIDVTTIGNQAALDVLKTQLSASTYVSSTVAEGVVEADYTLSDAAVHVQAANAINLVNIASDRLENNVAILAEQQQSALRVLHANDLAKAEADAAATLANAHAADQLIETNATIVNEYATTAATIAADITITSDQIANATAINTGAILNSNSINAIEIRTDTAKAQAEAANATKAANLSITNDINVSAERILFADADTNIRITTAANITKQDIADADTTSTTKIKAGIAKNAVLVLNEQALTTVQVSNILSSDAITDNYIRSSALVASLSEIASTKNIAALGLAETNTIMSTNLTVAGSKNQTASLLYDYMAQTAPLLAAYQANRMINQYSDPSSFQPISDTPPLPPIPGVPIFPFI